MRPRSSRGAGAVVGLLATALILSACGQAGSTGPSDSKRPAIARRAAERIPADARLLTAWLSKGLNSWQHGHRPVTTSDSSLVSRIRQDVNDLEVQPPGVYDCPADFGQVLHLDFRPKAGAAPVAVVLADTTGCEGVTVVRNGRAVTPSLDGVGFAAKVEKALGWRVG